MARLRPLLFAILTIALVAVTSYPIYQGQFLPKAHAANLHFSLAASVNGWNYSLPSGTNPTMTITDADHVVIDLNSADASSVQHRFYIDVDKNGIADCVTLNDICSQPFNSTTGAQVSWNPGIIAPGTYNYYDSYYQTTSKGTFIVLSAAPDYTIWASPSTLTILQGSSQTSTTTLASQNGFAGTISLTANPLGVTATLNPTTISLPANGVATSTLSVTVPASTAPGNYLVGVTGSNGTIQHNTIVNVQVVSTDFSITTNTNTLNVIQGSSATATITITSQNSFYGNVSLTDQISPTGPNPSLNPTTLKIASGSSQTSTLTVSTTRATSPVSYTITITGNSTSGNTQLTHSLTITLRVNPSSSTSPSSPILSTYLFGALAVVLIVTLVILVTKRRSHKQ